MKVCPRFCAIAVVALGLLAFSSRSGAQNIGLGAIDSPDPVVTNSTLTYTIFLTNLTAQTPLVYVTNLLPPTVNILDASVTPQGTATIGQTNVIFNLGQVPYPGVVQMTVITRPTAAGFITNRITAFAPPFPLAQTNVVTLVSNIPPVLADLAVAISGPAPPVLTNDWVTYQITVTNLGPASVSGVTLTNLLPAGFGVISVVPTNQVSTNAGLYFSVGTLANLAGRSFQLTLQPTNKGPATLTATVNGVGIDDPVSSNNIASVSFTVTNTLAAQLIASLVSTQKLNPQVTLMEQTIVVSNAGPGDVPSARVLVTGLTNYLFNAVGTNSAAGTSNRQPFVVHGAALPAGQSVNLLLQFYPNRSPFPFGTNQLHAMGTPQADLSAPASPGTGATNVGIFQLSSGGVLLTFPSVTGRVYTVTYSSDATFSNALTAKPPVVSGANYSQWIDYGPPSTISHPTNSNSRFYRVYLVP